MVLQLQTLSCPADDDRSSITLPPFPNLIGSPDLSALMVQPGKSDYITIVTDLNAPLTKL